MDTEFSKYLSQAISSARHALRNGTGVAAESEWLARYAAAVRSDLNPPVGLETITTLDLLSKARSGELRVISKDAANALNDGALFFAQRDAIGDAISASTDWALAGSAAEDPVARQAMAEEFVLEARAAVKN